jgi:hypothetical protein
MLALVSTPLESNSHSLGFHRKQPWMPNYALAMWKDDKLRKMVTLCVAFDRGVNLTTDVNYCILEDGTQLELKVLGIKRLKDVETLHEHQRSKNKDSLLSYHPKIIAFQELFKVIKAREEDNVVNEAVIHLPFPFNATFVEELRLQDQYSSLTVYLDMVAIEADTFSAKPKPVMDTMAKLPPSSTI